MSRFLQICDLKSKKKKLRTQEFYVTIIWCKQELSPSVSGNNGEIRKSSTAILVLSALSTLLHDSCGLGILYLRSSVCRDILSPFRLQIYDQNGKILISCFASLTLDEINEHPDNLHVCKDKVMMFSDVRLL